VRHVTARGSSRPPDRVSLVAGIACLLVGAVFGLDQLDVLSLSAGVAAATVCAAIGIVLVVSGIEPASDDGEDAR
jgi:hypothetical protein